MHTRQDYLHYRRATLDSVLPPLVKEGSLSGAYSASGRRATNSKRLLEAFFYPLWPLLTSEARRHWDSGDAPTLLSTIPSSTVSSAKQLQGETSTDGSKDDTSGTRNGEAKALDKI